MKFYNVLILAVVILIASVSSAFAWTNHTLIGYMALRDIPELNNDISAETIDSFLVKEKAKLSDVLEQEELWARENVRAYSPRPDSLKFSVNPEKDIRIRFLNAVRLNPRMMFTLYDQPLNQNDKRPLIEWAKISLYPRNFLGRPIVALASGDKVKAIEVVASATDEPDYGYDMGLYQDNDTPYGAVYGYGNQPMSNPKEFTYSQCGFHMGFYHESWIVFKAAPALKKTCPEQRAHLFYTLSKFAFETGHPYWGCRFAGMGLHYIMDLTQPYHACTLPGVSTLKLLWISILDAVGFHDSYTNALSKVTSEHILLESIIFERMISAFNKGQFTDPLLSAISDVSMDSKVGNYDGHFITNVVSKESYDRAGDVVDALNDVIVDRALFNKTEQLDLVGKFSVNAVIGTAPEKNKKYLDEIIQSIMRSAGSYTRIYMRSAIGNAKIK